MSIIDDNTLNDSDNFNPNINYNEDINYNPNLEFDETQLLSDLEEEELYEDDDLLEAAKKDELRKKAQKLRSEQGHKILIKLPNGVIKSVEKLTKTEQALEFYRCGIDPIYFIKTYLTIFDQTKGESGMIVSFNLFDFQEQLINDYRNFRFNVANKYRQAGISTTTCAYIAWYVMFNKNRSVAIVANKLQTARDELMNDVVEFINGCPEWLRPKPTKKDTQILKRYDNGCTIGAFSSKGLRGYTPTLLFWDETAWTEKADVFWEGTKPVLQTGGRAIFVSTPNGLDAVFYKTFELARKKKNAFNAIELWWFNDPRYNKELKWFKYKDKDNEIVKEDENFTIKQRIQLYDEGWEAWSPWFEEQIQLANFDMRKIKQEILCVFGDSYIIIKHKVTGIIEHITIREFYEKLLKEHNIS